MNCRQSLLILGLLLVAASGCKDPTAGPPPRRLGADQAARVKRALLTTRPSPAFPADVVFGGGKIRFLGSDVTPNPVGRGQAVRVSYYFESLAPLDKSWKIFVHVQPPGGQGVLANGDHFPVDQLYPTDRWLAGQIIEDRHVITVPASAPEDLVGYIGFYRFDDRLPVDSPERHDGANRVEAFRLKVSGQQAALPTYRAARRSANIRIDGVLDDEGWKGLASTGPFARTQDGSNPKYNTEAKLTWDDSAIYVAFDCEDEDVWAKFEKKDEPIYQEEVVEVFLDADGDGRTYNELQVSPRNVQFDAFFPARRQGMDLAWDSGMETAVQIRGTLNDQASADEGWSAEMKIPVSRLAAVPAWPPKLGDRWRINLYRLEWHSDRRVNEGAAFSPPLVGDFHHLPRFGILEFVAGK